MAYFIISKLYKNRNNKKKRLNNMFNLFFVGATGFEPATTCSQNRRATGLRYTPLQQPRIIFLN